MPAGGGRKHVRAFTMVELLLAGLITALVASASAALISAVSTASITTRDLRGVKNAGNFALARITSTIRESRCMGSVTTSSMTLWLSDTNSNDSPDLYESGIIRYDASLKQIIFEFMQGSPPPSSSPITTAQLTSPATLSSLMTGSNKRSIVWAEGVETCSFEGYPSGTDTRIVQVRFTLGTGADETVFRTTASPRGGGDYLFATSAKETPPWSSRPTRAKRTPYSGVSSGGY